MVAAVHEVPNDAAISGVDFDELYSIDIAERCQVLFDKRVSELVSAKLVKRFAPELVVFLELQVFNGKLGDMPSLAKFENMMVDLIELKMNLVLRTRLKSF